MSRSLDEILRKNILLFLDMLPFKNVGIENLQAVNFDKHFS